MAPDEELVHVKQCLCPECSARAACQADELDVAAKLAIAVCKARWSASKREQRVVRIVRGSR